MTIVDAAGSKVEEAEQHKACPEALVESGNSRRNPYIHSYECGTVAIFKPVCMLVVQSAYRDIVARLRTY
jgi:hypothetical protein